MWPTQYFYQIIKKNPEQVVYVQLFLDEIYQVWFMCINKIILKIFVK